VITQYTDFNFYKDFDREHAFVMEDAAFPSLMAWFVEGFRPGFSRIPTLFSSLLDIIRRYTTGTNTGRVGGVLRRTIGEPASSGTVVFLNMGVDKADGTMSLGKDQLLRMDWPYRNSMELYKAILAGGTEFSRTIWARYFIPLLTWVWPFRRAGTVHPLGGCVLATDRNSGVTNASRDRLGEVFGYRNLYVLDGAMVPAAIGSNPTATISALCEMANEAITGQKATPDLRPPVS
jgi:cholesterol oxidase